MSKLGRGSPIKEALRALSLGGLAGSSSQAASGPLSNSTFVVMSADANLAVERVLTAGAGLTLADGGAGSTATLAVGAGTGITVNADDVQVNLSYAFTWAALHIFDAGARITDGQTLGFGTTIALSRKADNILQLAAGDNFQSPTYTSGLQGWSINASGDAEFNNLNVRGEIHAAVFVYGEIHATAGTLGVFKSAGKLLSDATSVTTPTTFTLDIKDPDTAHAQLFAVNDILRIKDGGGLDNWMTVGSVSDQTTFFRYTVTKNSGTNGTFRAGAAVVDYGPSGQGFVTISADGTVGSSPNISLATHAGSPWTTQTIRMRFGNLNGSYGIVTDIYGFGVGDYTGSNYLRYDPTNGFVFQAGSGKVLINSSGLTITADATD